MFILERIIENPNIWLCFIIIATEKEIKHVTSRRVPSEKVKTVFWISDIYCSGMLINSLLIYVCVCVCMCIGGVYVRITVFTNNKSI